MATRNEKRAEADRAAEADRVAALPTTAQIAMAESAWDRLREQPEMVGYPLMTQRDQTMFHDIYCAGYVQALQDMEQDAEGRE